MVKKLSKSSITKPAAALGETVKDSAQQFLQAGMGVFSKAQMGGAKALETLVKDSASIQRKTKAVAEETISEATSKVTHMANDISKQASGQWDKLENIFEERVAKALHKLGVPSATDISALMTRLDALAKEVRALAGKSAPASASTSSADTSAQTGSRKAPSRASAKAASKTKAPAAKKPAPAKKATKAAAK